MSEEEWTRWALHVGRSVRSYRRFYASVFVACLMVPVGASFLPVWPYQATLSHPNESAWTQQNLHNLTDGTYGWYFACSHDCSYNITRTYYAGLLPIGPTSPQNVIQPTGCFFLIGYTSPTGAALITKMQIGPNQLILLSNSSSLKVSIC